MTVFGLIGRYWVKSTSQCDKDCQAAGAEYRRFSVVWTKLRRQIAEAPQLGTDSGLGDGSRFISVAPDKENQEPGLTVLYRYDETTIYLIRLRAKPF